ncbi:unnamed protein product [Meganyctiphanes norvegica]|uniref:Secreted protein n=1 Tax=Meganyctiphanes norvegica TaxID=48144 RepID=A0AAV2S5R3_MEGNR
MSQRHCALLVLFGATFAYSNPAWFYNTGFGSADLTRSGCSSFTKEYDPYTGFFSYRCKPTAMINKPFMAPANVQNIPVMIPYAGRSGGSHDTVMYRPVTSGRSGYRKKNNKPKRPTKSRRNRCPTGQIFQSELNICIDYPSAPPLPPRPSQPIYSRLNPYDRMVGDAPVRASASRKKAPASGTILKVGKIDLKNRCKPSEVYVSELDICLPYNNCYPHGSTC